MSPFWRTVCLLLLGLALGLGQPLRALAAQPLTAPAEPMLASADSMPCHEAAASAAEDAPPCPHCSHGQTGWGCGHCAGCLLGAALLMQAVPGAPLVEADHGDWTPAAEAAARPVTGRVPTPPPKLFFA